MTGSSQFLSLHTHQAAPLPPMVLGSRLSKHKCACGGSAGLDGECAQCHKTKLQRGIDQPTLLTAEEPKAKAIPTDKGTEVAAMGVAEESDEMAAEPKAEPETLEEGHHPEEGQPTAAPASETSSESGAAKEKITFSLIHTTQPFSTGRPFKARCPAPVAAPTAFPTSRSSAAAIAAMGACVWGITAPDPLRVSTRICNDAGHWKLRVTGVNSRIRTFSRQLPGQNEPTRRNSTAANFCGQVTDLDTLGNCPGNWYMLQAVRAHEAVHALEWKTSFGSDWPRHKTIIENLSVAVGGATRTAAAALRSLRASAAFQGALQTGAAEYPAFWGIPDPNNNTNAAERAIVFPRVKDLCVHARERGWGPAACPVCAANGIT